MGGWGAHRSRSRSRGSSSSSRRREPPPLPFSPRPWRPLENSRRTLQPQISLVANQCRVSAPCLRSSRVRNFGRVFFSQSRYARAPTRHLADGALCITGAFELSEGKALLPLLRNANVHSASPKPPESSLNILSLHAVLKSADENCCCHDSSLGHGALTDFACTNSSLYGRRTAML